MGRDLLVPNLSKVIGDGTITRVWKDPWISTTQPLTPIDPPREEDTDLYVSDLLCRGSAEWNIPKITSTLPQRHSQNQAECDWCFGFLCLASCKVRLIFRKVGLLGSCGHES